MRKISKHTSLILKTEPELKSWQIRLKKTLDLANKSAFWHSHFANRKFRYNPKKFSWEYWREIPTISKTDFLNLGLEKRLIDSNKVAPPLVLQQTSGTSKQTVPIVFLKKIGSVMDREIYNTKCTRTVFFYQGRAISLRNILADNTRGKQKNGTFAQCLAVNPFGANDKMLEAITQFDPDCAVTFPACVSYLSSYLPHSRHIFSSINYIWFSGDFLSQKQLAFIKKRYPKLTVSIDYLMTELDTVGIGCRALQTKYGTNAYHPYQDRFVELTDIDEDGYGEVTVTKTTPPGLSYIRYRTGDIARSERISCSCGSQWAFFLEGRKNLDYIKGLGVLITRFEIERTIKTFVNEIEEWRGEVREVKSGGIFVGELTLLIKPRGNINFDKHRLEKMKDEISNGLRLTPQKTLAKLAQEKKFMPLILHVINEFPASPKKVLLRKIVN